MDQQFESEVMQDLGAELPPMAAEDTMEEMEAAESEGFEDDDAMEEEMEDFEEGVTDPYLGEEGFEDEFADEAGDVFAEEETDELDALEEVLADALDAADSDEFFGRLLSGISRVAGLVGRGAGAARRVARTVGRAAQTAGRVAGRARRVAGQVGRVAGQVSRIAGRASRSSSPLHGLIGQLLPMLQQWSQQGADEFDALEDLADWFAEEDLDEALPVLAGLAARAVLRPALRRVATQLSTPVRRQLVRSATQAARTLVSRQGPQALRALPRIVQSIGRAAARRRLRPATLPRAIRQTTARVAMQPRLVRRLAQPVATDRLVPRQATFGRGMPRRFMVRGPVEIHIISR